MKIFNTRDDLKAAILQAGQNCKTNGLDQALDGGNGEYYIDLLVNYNGGVPPAIDSPDVSTANGNVGRKLADSTLPLGAIIMYSGDMTDIPEGWGLCDGGGNPARPNLLGLFVLGATSNADINTTGGFSDITLPANTGSTTLTSAQSGLPAHTHDGQLVSSIDNNGAFISGGYDGGGDRWVGDTGNTAPQDAAAGHSHTTTYDGTDKNIPPYYKLAYIIRTGEIKQVLSTAPPEGTKEYIDVSGSVNLDAGFGQYTVFTVKPAAAITINIVNVPLGVDVAYGCSIKLIADDVPSAVTWGTQFNWQNNTPPTLVTIEDNWDWLSAVTVDNGASLDATLSIPELD